MTILLFEGLSVLILITLLQKLNLSDEQNLFFSGHQHEMSLNIQGENMKNPE